MKDIKESDEKMSESRADGQLGDLPPIRGTGQGQSIVTDKVIMHRHSLHSAIALSFCRVSRCQSVKSAIAH